ncbi:MAG: hypothetical protein KKE86_06355 [Planctomycetes bacterium]|nr:hypothetical protein [Planctomycetota bacterium]MBU4398943.1 hypothetical protein [Planctomycetota bacterium]MCG2684267.1 hypothetical protein [Planctomycetales bacterium]
MKTPVVLFGDHVAAYGVIRSLGPLGIPIFVVSPKANGVACSSRYVRKSLALSYDEPDFIDRLNQWIASTVGQEAVLIATGIDEYLDVLSKNRDRLPAGLLPTYPAWERVVLVRDKRETYRLCEELGIGIPKTHYFQSRDDLDRLLANGLDMEPPYLLKPQKSTQFLKTHGKRLKVCRTSEEIVASFEEYEGSGVVLALQELIPGGDGCLENVLVVLNRDGDPLGAFMNRKRRTARGMGSCTMMETSWSQAVLNDSIRLLKRIGYYGYANPEFKVDPRDGVPKLMEINGRVTLSNSHALRCGINLPHLMYREAVEGPLPGVAEFSRTYGNNIVWWNPIGDAITLGHSLCEGSLKVRPLLSSFRIRGCVMEPFNRRDPGPGLRVFRQLFSLLWRRITGRGPKV